jgi:hypothetical protein
VRPLRSLGDTAVAERDVQRGFDVIVMLHPDGQYEPTLIPDLVRPIVEGRADLVPFQRTSLDFSFDSELLMQAVHFGFRIAEVPARSYYFDDASSIKFRPAAVYRLKTLWTALRLVLHRRGILRSRKFMP